jgi:hypothetical protein
MKLRRDKMNKIQNYWTDGLVTVYSCPPNEGDKVCLGRMPVEKAHAIQRDEYAKENGWCVWYQFK